MTEDKRAEHLDKIMRCCAFLMKKYEIHEFPELELSPEPIRHECVDGKDYFLKGLLQPPWVDPKIVVTHDADVELAICHEFHHYLEFLDGAVSKSEAHPGQDIEKEVRIQERALRDLDDFKLWDIAFKIDLENRKAERAARIRKQYGAS